MIEAIVGTSVFWIPFSVGCIIVIREFYGFKWLKKWLPMLIGIVLVFVIGYLLAEKINWTLGANPNITAILNGKPLN